MTASNCPFAHFVTLCVKPPNSLQFSTGELSNRSTDVLSSGDARKKVGRLSASKPDQAFVR